MLVHLYDVGPVLKQHVQQLPIIPNKRTTPNKRAPPPSFSCTLYIKSAGLKKPTRHQPSACSRVNMVEPRSAYCERGCKRGMLLLHVAKLLYMLF